MYNTCTQYECSEIWFSFLKLLPPPPAQKKGIWRKRKKKESKLTKNSLSKASRGVFFPSFLFVYLFDPYIRTYNIFSVLDVYV